METTQKYQEERHCQSLKYNIRLLEDSLRHLPPDQVHGHQLPPLRSLDASHHVHLWSTRSCPVVQIPAGRYRRFCVGYANLHFFRTSCGRGSHRLGFVRNHGLIETSRVTSHVLVDTTSGLLSVFEHTLNLWYICDIIFCEKCQPMPKPV